MDGFYRPPGRPKPEPSPAQTFTGIPSQMPLSQNMSINGSSTLDRLTLDMKSLVKKIQALNRLGIEDSKIALPKICVVGDQSTGKSSLVEGISEINVPRKESTCTRCPLEINLSSSKPGEPWTCVIYLSHRYVFDPAKQLTRPPKRSEPLGPWVSMSGQDDELFLTLTDRHGIEYALEWAQLAILNPGEDWHKYVPGNNSGTPETIQVKFSPNVVRLDISAPDFPNLSFYDLPGVICQAEQEDERYLVPLVENLVKGYVSQENCIVLLTLTMTDDATNSSAAKIIRDIAGADKRTLGVLTKPDRVPPTNESLFQWIEILGGYKFAFGHGYFVVRNNPSPRTIDHPRARDEEERFFANAPWATDLAPYQHRFGTRRLQTALSDLLMEQIEGCLPSIKTNINVKASRIQKELLTLPDSPTEGLQQILIKKVFTLCEKIKASIEGGTTELPLQKVWIRLVEDFQKALSVTRPTVHMDSSSDELYLAPDKDCMADGSRTRKPKAPTADTNPPARAACAGYHTPHFELNERWKRTARSFTWEEIESIKEEFERIGVPNQVDPRSIEKLNRLSVQHWEPLMETFLDATHGLLSEMLFKVLDTVFDQYHQTALFRELQRILMALLEKRCSVQRKHAKETFEIEFQKPFTMAQAIHKDGTREALEYFTRLRQQKRACCYLKLRGLFQEGEQYHQVTVAQLGSDQFAQELEMMAASRGYYNIASQRFLDGICQSVWAKLFSKCSGDDLFDIIEHELRVSGDNAHERILELMTEDPERRRRREMLQREHEKLAKAQEWLASTRMGDDSAHV